MLLYVVCILCINKNISFKTYWIAKKIQQHCKRTPNKRKQHNHEGSHFVLR